MVFRPRSGLEAARKNFSAEFAQVLFDGAVVSMTGAIGGGIWTLVCAYVAEILRKTELVLNFIREEDLLTTWSHPSPDVHAAATAIQGVFR